MTKELWAECFVRQWQQIETAASHLGCIKRLHIWPDPELKGYVDNKNLEKWLYRQLMQAIARVNPVFQNKPRGLTADYLALFYDSGEIKIS